jgi:hypothetical protein
VMLACIRTPAMRLRLDSVRVHFRHNPQFWNHEEAMARLAIIFRAIRPATLRNVVSPMFPPKP